MYFFNETLTGFFNSKDICFIIIIVVTQFWIHQDFLECYFISIIIYKNPKKIKKNFKIQKYIFLESTASFNQNRVHRVNTGQTMSTRVKNEFWAVSGQNLVHRVNTGQTMSTRIKNEFRAVSGQKPSFSTKTRFTGLIPIKFYFFFQCFNIIFGH